MFPQSDHPQGRCHGSGLEAELPAGFRDPDLHQTQEHPLGTPTGKSEVHMFFSGVGEVGGQSGSLNPAGSSTSSPDPPLQTRPQLSSPHF